FPQPSSSASRITGSSHPSGATTTIASIQPEPSSRSRLSASSGRPRNGANALGRSKPSRSPRPAAASTAQIFPATPEISRNCLLTLSADGGKRCLLLTVGDAREHLVEPHGSLIFVHLLRVHQLAREDLLGLDEHLLLAGGQPLLVVAQGQVPDDFGKLEDVAGLHLVAIVLEAAIPVFGHLRAAARQCLDDDLDHDLAAHLAEAD